MTDIQRDQKRLDDKGMIWTVICFRERAYLERPDGSGKSFSMGQVRKMTLLSLYIVGENYCIKCQKGGVIENPPGKHTRCGTEVLQADTPTIDTK